MNRFLSFFLPLSAMLLLGLWQTPAMGQTKLLEAPCIWLFKQQKWTQAARCFGAKAQALPKEKRYYRGRLLRNAALLWRKAANSGPKEMAAARLQQAILLFRLYYREKLCLDNVLCQQASAQVKTLCQQVGCGSLQIIPQPAFAQIAVSVGHWSLHKRSQWYSSQMPPGRYQLVISAPGLPTKSSVVSILPHQQQKLTISLLPKPPVPARVAASREEPPVARRIARQVPVRPAQPATPSPKASVPVFGWVATIAGAVLLVGGGALLGAGHATFADFRSNVWQQGSVSSTPEALASARGQSDAMAASGISMLGVGGALGISGVIALLLHKPAISPDASPKK